MNKAKKFSSSMLLMGKVATLPMLVSQAHADVTPAYTDITTSQLTLVELPQANQLRLLSLTADAANTPSSYSTSAILCSNSMPSTMSVVVTGVNPGDSVFVVASSDKNFPGHTALNPRATIGASNLAIVGVSMLSNAPGTTGGARAAVTVPVNLGDISTLTAAPSFYMQALVIPQNAATPASWRFSELDEIRKGVSATNSYGQVTSYCN